MSFVYTIDNNLKRPTYSWSLSDDKSIITLNTVEKPVSVKLYQAYNRRSRAFILNCYLTCLWTSSEIFDSGNGTYVGKVTIPDRGYVAYMLEIEYDIGWTRNFVTSTGVSIVPDAFDHPPCPDSECGLCSTLSFFLSFFLFFVQWCSSSCSFVT